MSSTSRDLLEPIIEPVVAAEGLDLEDIQVSPVGRRTRLRVVVDADGGVDLDKCADVSRRISRALDETDVMGQAPYTLEVSSPGVSRPLTQPRHWARSLGRLVRIRLYDGTDVTGRVVSSGEDSVVIDIDGAARELVFDDIRKAKVQVEFHRANESVGE